MARKFAVFDIDGTLIRWQLYHGVVDNLAKRKLISDELFQTARAARMEWKKRTDPDAFKVYERKLVRIFDKAIITISYDDFMASVQAVFMEYKDQTYVYTRNLIRQLKEQGYMLFAISASQIQIVELLAKHYGFDDCGGSRYEVKDGAFTGRKFVLLREEKPKLLEWLVAKHKADFTGSIGVGDSESDIPMLMRVAQPIAFNPSQLLYTYAREQRWKIVVERKNVVYELMPQKDNHGSYLLA